MTQIIADLVPAAASAHIEAPGVERPATKSATHLLRGIGAFVATLAVAAAGHMVLTYAINTTIDRHYEAKLAEMRLPPIEASYAMAVAAANAADAEEADAISATAIEAPQLSVSAQ
jgi:hypothetical protein